MYIKNLCTNIALQSENKAAYMFTVEFIRKNSSYLEPFIQLVSRVMCLMVYTLVTITHHVAIALTLCLHNTSCVYLS